MKYPLAVYFFVMGLYAIRGTVFLHRQNFGTGFLIPICPISCIQLLESKEYYAPHVGLVKLEYMDSDFRQHNMELDDYRNR